jgi:sigma-B regulation protein RsbU (phosphoserine phosphatase)
VSTTSFQPEPKLIEFTPSWGSAAEVGSEPEKTSAKGDDSRITIIIAEDDPVSREVISTLVSKWGFRSIVTHDGHEAMAAIRAEPGPVLAILDWMMPGMDGLEVCRRVRQIDKPAHIILLTARTAKESLVQGLESGADDYLVKPFDKNELLARIHAGFRIIHLQETLSHRVKELEAALPEVKELRSRLFIPL